MAIDIRDLKAEHRHGREVDASERRNLVLTLENALLRFERRLPPDKGGEP